jgi:hypothetical protein
MRITLGLIALAMTAPAYTQTSPEAPMLTAGAEFKGLRFDWEPAAGASWYELEYRANQGSTFTRLGSELPATATSFRYRFPLHLFDWTHARYRLAACNANGCTRSTEVSVSDLRREAVGYFKSDVSVQGLQFGTDTDLSPDGLNLVTVAPYDAGPDSYQHTGAVHVFRRGANGVWVQRAKLNPPRPAYIWTGTNDMRVRISADGNTVVLGMPNSTTQEPPEEGNDTVTGEAYVFHFDGARWHRSRLYSGANDRGRFGNWVGINDAGDIVAVDAGDSSTYTVPRKIYLYRKINGSWQPVRAIGATMGTEFCQHGALSGDGSAVVETCRAGTMISTTRRYLRIHSGPNWTVREEIPFEMVAPSTATRFSSIGIAVDDTGSTIAAQIFTAGPGQHTGPVEVQVFRRQGTFTRVAVLTPGAWRNAADNSWYGLALALSGDGGTLAVGDAFDNGYGTGPRAAPLTPTTSTTGAVYVYRLRSDTWRLANMIKPNYQGSGLLPLFGMDVSLNFNGQTLAVGHPNESSSATGIGGNWASGETSGSGAVFMY